MSNVGVVGGFVNGNHNAGGVVGCSYGGTVQNRYSTGAVNGKSSAGGVPIGGVVGGLYNGFVKSCYTGMAGDGGNGYGGVLYIVSFARFRALEQLW